MKGQLKGTLFCLAFASSMVQAQGFGGLGSVTAETDADHFSTVRARAGGLFDYSSPWQYAGVAVQTTAYSQSGWREHATGVVALWRDQSRATLDGITAEVGVVQVGSYVRAVADVGWALRPAPGTGVQLLASAGLVETQVSIEKGVAYSFWGASIEQQLGSAVTIIGLAGYQPFTDGIDRVHFRARAICDAWPDQGVNLQAQYNQSAGFSNAPDYWWSSVSVSLIVPF